MGKSGRVRLVDLTRAHRLIHDCRDVGHDPAAWPAVLAEGMIRLIDSPLVLVGQVVLGEGGPRNLIMADRGWETPAHREVWHRRHVVESDYRGVETFSRFLAVPGRLKTRSREQLIGDTEWYRSYEYNEIHRSMGQDDLVASTRFPGAVAARSLFGIIGIRPVGAGPISTKNRRLLRLFQVELDRHLGTSIVLDSGGPLTTLQPRLRRTLDCLLEGDGEKQAAVRLGLSRNTVHEYVIELYRHLGVNSRGELMAYCLRLKSTPARGRT